MPKKSHPDRPDELERLASLPPLVEEREREDEGDQRGRGGEGDGHAAVTSGARLGGLMSGGDELVVVPVEPVAQAEAGLLAGNADRAHQLADGRRGGRRGSRGSASRRERSRDHGGTGMGPD